MLLLFGFLFLEIHFVYKELIRRRHLTTLQNRSVSNVNKFQNFAENNSSVWYLFSFSCAL